MPSCPTLQLSNNAIPMLIFSGRRGGGVKMPIYKIDKLTLRSIEKKLKNEYLYSIYIEKIKKHLSV